VDCPFCGDSNTKVLESRSTEDNQSIRRRRECSKCLKRFTTYERIELSQIVVLKTSTAKEIYSRDKLFTSIVRACSKSQISSLLIDEIVDIVEAEIYKSFNREIPSSKIGELVMKALYEADQVAYIRYASIFKKFTSLEEFMEELRSMEDGFLGLKYEERV
jgi:transcriptional repressor NrdR